MFPKDFAVISLPDFHNLAVGELDIRGALSIGIWTVVFTFTFVEFFDTFGTLVGTANKAGLIDKDGNSPKIGKAKQVHWMMYILFALVVIRYIFLSE